MNNPYKIDRPGIISFSGGATSGFMLWHIIQAYDGKLPDDIKIVFSNTGLEHLKTLEFVRNVELNWRVKVYWLEYRTNKKWLEVNYENASRNGEPFDMMIDEKKYLPSPVFRFCTSELKVLTIDRWAESIGLTDGRTEVLGLRYDEPHRVAKAKSNSSLKREIDCPIYDSRHTLEDVEKFWKQHSFRLEIPRILGNCVGCFLKGKEKTQRIAKDYPGSLEWWALREEKPIGQKQDGTSKFARFRSDRPSYRGLIQMAESQQEFVFTDDDTLPCNCTD
jgi:3'-phosphoadenosine 5'-phosphosulfate sulfotransferase (PAPS reductase)/FAD synthetase